MDPQTPGCVHVAVPADIESLRRDDPAEARAWRTRVRAELGSALAGGGRIIGFDRDRWLHRQDGGTRMRLHGFELRRVAMPLVSPFRTSFGTQTERDVLIVRALTDGADGWGECVTLGDPLYSPEYVEGAVDVMRRHLIPALAGVTEAPGVGEALKTFKGHRMSKGALEMAVLDAELRAEGRSFARELGSVHDRVPCGVSVGIMDSIPAAARRRRRLPLGGVRPHQAQDRARLGHRAPSARCGSASATTCCCRSTRTRRTRCATRVISPSSTTSTCSSSSSRSKRRTCSGHADLAKIVRTPICLDESITSAQTAAAAIRLGATQVINIKPGRVGGYLEARRIHDLAAAHGIAVWCGGMIESGIGRAANVALASLPGFTLPGDVSASDRFYRQDITAPFVMRDGHLDVPTGPGLGVEPDMAILESLTTWVERVTI